MSTYYPTIVVPAKAGNHKSSQKTIQKAQKVVIDLREKYLPKEIKIWLDS